MIRRQTYRLCMSWKKSWTTTSGNDFSLLPQSLSRCTIKRRQMMRAIITVRWAGRLQGARESAQRITTKTVISLPPVQELPSIAGNCWKRIRSDCLMRNILHTLKILILAIVQKFLDIEIVLRQTL